MATEIPDHVTVFVPEIISVSPADEAGIESQVKSLVLSVRIKDQIDAHSLVQLLRKYTIYSGESEGG